MERADLIKKLKDMHPHAMDYVIELLVDVHLKDPEWTRKEAKRLQREDMKGGKHKRVVEKAPTQFLYPNVEVVVDENISNHEVEVEA